MNAVQSPYDHHMAFQLVDASQGRAVYEVQVGPSLANPTGRLHGGVLAGLADSAMGAAFLTTLAPGASGTNLDLHIDFLRPTQQGKLRAHATVIKAGRTISRLTCEVTDEAGQLVARANSSFLMLPGDTTKAPIRA